MEYLRELAHIVTKSRLRKLDMLHITPEKGQKNAYTEYYEALQKSKNTPGTDIGDILGWDTSTANYRMFKTRFFNKLLNTLLFLDPGRKSFHALRAARYQCMRNQYCINILLMFSARNTAVHLAKKTLTISQKHEITEVSVFCVKVLRSHSSLTGNIKDFEEYHRQYTYYTKVLAAEDKAREEYERISIHYANSTSLKPQFAPLAIKAARTVKRLRLKYGTYHLYIYYYRLQGLATYISQDYISAIATWDRYERYIKRRKSSESSMRLAEAAINRMACYLHLRNYQEGSMCAAQCKVLMEPGSHNWFYFLEYFFLLAMHSKRYTAAGNILQEAINHPRHNFLSDIRKEKWRIFTAYYTLANQLFNDEHQNTDEQPRFRISKFMNETPLYAKDKRGYNTAILIIQFMHALNNGNFIEVINKAEALNRYSERYLKKDTTFRGRLFIKMLLSAADAGFDLRKTEENTRSFSKMLTSTQMVYTGNMDGMEIIPFEDLWDKVIAILSKQKAYA